MRAATAAPRAGSGMDEAARNAALLRPLDQQVAELEQRAIATTDVEHAGAGLNEVGDQQMIDARRRDRAVFLAGEHQAALLAGAMPWRAAAELMKPLMVWNSTGSSSRKASWPLSLSTSTKLTLAATAFSACTSLRLSCVG